MARSQFKWEPHVKAEKSPSPLVGVGRGIPEDRGDPPAHAPQRHLIGSPRRRRRRKPTFQRWAVCAAPSQGALHAVDAFIEAPRAGARADVASTIAQVAVTPCLAQRLLVVAVPRLRRGRLGGRGARYLPEEPIRRPRRRLTCWCRGVSASKHANRHALARPEPAPVRAPGSV
eukprot:CAMPEP_0203865836 /NCGR_PEP_ID=MMETSP0359-20131031/15591_1 /ASSEMBLY_ACC=CAM_ASM_000338 /TAXON_ID=268821 /ORGANISM="Scrippsiella Hangoei, Strain SHTV-5" /LENGTH=172 /DNA_ID=CAMNT_0050783823 /DNA_START=21 /DNA_END=539 /DNA_ORIENTATION=-